MPIVKAFTGKGFRKNTPVNCTKTNSSLSGTVMLPEWVAIFPGVHDECIGEICSPDKISKIPALVAVLREDFLTE